MKKLLLFLGLLLFVVSCGKVDDSAQEETPKTPTTPVVEKEVVNQDQDQEQVDEPVISEPTTTGSEVHVKPDTTSEDTSTEKKVETNTQSSSQDNTTGKPAPDKEEVSDGTTDELIDDMIGDIDDIFKEIESEG